MGTSRVCWLIVSLMLSLTEAVCASRVAATTSSRSNISFEQETLANGLRVIYVPMHRAPVADVRVVYHVGSRDEQAGRHGFAHLFEHMMFRGSAHVGPEEYPRLIRSVGGSYDGQTTRDSTTYFQTVPRNQLALALWLEADRMASFHVTEPVYRIERNVVLEELALRADQPYWVPREDLIAQIFRSSPYAWSPAGDPADVKAARVEELESFFERYYVPNNATLIITGDFDPAAARKLVERYFGWIRRGANVRRSIVSEPRQTSARHIKLTGPVAHPVLMIGCQAPRYRSGDRAAVNVLAAVIGSRLRHYLEVSEHPLCSSTLTNRLTLEDDGCLYIGATLLPGASVKAVERIITVQLNILRTEGMYISAADFAAARRSVCQAILRRRETVQGMAEQIGQAVAAGGDVGDCDRYLQRMRELTPVDVWAAAQKYVRPEAMTFVIVNPETSRTRRPSSEMSDDLPDRTATTEDAERDAHAVVFPAGYPSTAPVAEQPLPVREHPIQEFEVQGLHVLLAHDSNADLALRLFVPRGTADDPPGREGLGELTAELVAKMASKPDHDFDVGIPFHAPFEYSVHQGLDFTEIGVRTPMRMAGHLMHEIYRALSAEMELGLFDSRLVTLKWKLFNDAIANNEREEPVADSELRAALFAGTPWGRRLTVPALRAISRKDLIRWRRRLFNLNGAILIMGGDLDVSHAKALASRLLDGLPEAKEAVSKKVAAKGSTRRHREAMNDSGARTEPRIILVDSPNARQSVIRIGLRTPAWGPDELAAAEMGRWILAQRIWREVRAEKGYAYHVTARFDRFRDMGELEVGTETSCDRTGATVAMLLENLRRISKEPVSRRERHDAMRAYAGELAIDLQTPGEQAHWRAMALLQNEDADPAVRVQRVRAVNAKQIQAIFSTCLRMWPTTVVVVGPAFVVKSQFAPIGKIEVLAMPNHRPGAATRPAFEELPRPM